MPGGKVRNRLKRDVFVSAIPCIPVPHVKFCMDPSALKTSRLSRYKYQHCSRVKSQSAGKLREVDPTPYGMAALRPSLFLPNCPIDLFGRASTHVSGSYVRMDVWTLFAPLPVIPAGTAPARPNSRLPSALRHSCVCAKWTMLSVVCVHVMFVKHAVKLS